MTDTIDARRIIELLRFRHPAPEWATFAELRGGTGYANLQHLDFFALHLWPSEGFRAVAYEVKVSRSDFAKEIDKPRKRAFAESIATECYFAVPHGLVEPVEVPEGWGLLVANAGGLKRVKLPTQHRISPSDWPPEFIASIARRASDPAPTLPQVAWKVLGREVSDKDLIAIAEQAFKKTVEAERQEAIFDERQRFRQSAEHRDLLELMRAVEGLCGWEVNSASAFRAWFNRQGKGLTTKQGEAITKAYTALGEMVQALAQGDD
jgi:hypothetical protein